MGAGRDLRDDPAEPSVQFVLRRDDVRENARLVVNTAAAVSSHDVSRARKSKRYSESSCMYLAASRGRRCRTSALS